MRLAIEGFVTTFFLIILLYLSLGLIYSQVIVNEARTYHTTAVKEIKASAYDPDYIDAYIADAESKGYELWIDVVASETVTCQECNYVQVNDELLNLNSEFMIYENYVCETCGQDILLDFDFDRVTDSGTYYITCSCGSEYSLTYNIQVNTVDYSLLTGTYQLLNSSNTKVVDGFWEPTSLTHQTIDKLNCVCCNSPSLSYNYEYEGSIVLVYNTHVGILGVSERGYFETLL